MQLPQSVLNNTWPAKFSNDTVYQVQIPQNVGYEFNYEGSSGNFQSIPNTTNLHGFTTLYSPHFAKGVR